MRSGGRRECDAGAPARPSGRRHLRCSTVAAAPGAGSLWAPTKPTTWPTCVAALRGSIGTVSPHVTIDGHLEQDWQAAQDIESIAGSTRHAGYARSACAAASGSRKCSAGSRVRPGLPRSSCVVAGGSMPHSPWRWPPTTSRSACSGAAGGASMSACRGKWRIVENAGRLRGRLPRHGRASLHSLRQDRRRVRLRLRHGRHLRHLRGRRRRVHVGRQ